MKRSLKSCLKGTLKLAFLSKMVKTSHDLWVSKRNLPQWLNQATNRSPSSQHRLTIGKFLRLDRLATPASQRDEGHHPLTKQHFINDYLENNQNTWAKKKKATCTSSFTKNFSLADRRTQLIAPRTCHPSSFLPLF